MLYVKRFLGNTNEMEVHDTNHRKVGCRLDEIKPEHKEWYDTLADAKRRGFDNCHWCIGRSQR